MKRAVGVLAATIMLAGMASAQTLVAPTACVLENARSVALPTNPYLEPESNPAQPVGWWNSVGIISDAELIKDGAPVPAVWPQHEYGFSSAKSPRVRNPNNDASAAITGEVMLTFDMGGVINMTGMVLWNHAEGDATQSNRGVQYAKVAYSSDGVTFTDSGEMLNFAKGPQDPDKVTLTPVDADPQYLTTPISGITHVRLTVKNFDGNNTAVGMGEFRIIGDRPFAPKFTSDPVLKPNVTWGDEYALQSQTLAGSATNAGGGTIFYDKTDGPDWLVVATNGALSGVADVTGTNVFTIRAIAGAESTSGTLQIIVDTVGSAPEFTTDPVVKGDAVFNEEYALQSQSLDGSATDLDGDTLIYSRAGGGPGWLNVASNGALSGVCNVLGTNSFPIQVTDGNGNFDTAVLEIFVPTLGSAPEFTVDPIITADGAFNRNYGLKGQTLAGTATDVDGDTLTYSKSGGPAWLNVASNGALTGISSQGGTNTFDVTVNDGNGNTDTATLLIYVQPLPVGDLIVGIDTFENTSAPFVDYEAAGISATATASGGWSTTDSGADPGRGSSKDTTWGTHPGPDAASDVTTIGTANYTLTNGKITGEVTITINNTGGEDLELGAFHVDALAFRPNAARTYALNVLEGSDITVTNVFTSAEDQITHLGGGLKTDDADPETHNQHDDIDIVMTDLPDNILEAGGTAILQIVFSDGTGSGGGHHLFIDNIGVSLAGEELPPDPTNLSIETSGSDVIISWVAPEGAFKLQSKDDLISGTWADYPNGDTSPVTAPASLSEEHFRLIEQ